MEDIAHEEEKVLLHEADEGPKAVDSSRMSVPSMRMRPRSGS